MNKEQYNKMARINEGISSGDDMHFYNTGYESHNDREAGLLPDVFLNPNVYKDTFPDTRGITLDGGRQIVMPSKPLGDRYNISDWEKTYWHERKHQNQNFTDERYDTSLPWHNREHEVDAETGALAILRNNLKRAGMEYTPQTGRDWLWGEAPSRYHNVEMVENPSKAPFLDRLTYLPKAQENREYGILEGLFPTEQTYGTTTDYDMHLESKQNMMNNALQRFLIQPSEWENYDIFKMKDDISKGLLGKVYE
tara:strand:- start:408 stop:1163 length:756 start_codon:yes stop_codon:yes gene_type:complete